MLSPKITQLILEKLVTMSIGKPAENDHREMTTGSKVRHTESGETGTITSYYPHHKGDIEWDNPNSKHKTKFYNASKRSAPFGDNHEPVELVKLHSANDK